MNLEVVNRGKAQRICQRLRATLLPFGNTCKQIAPQIKLRDTGFKYHQNTLGRYYFMHC